MELKNLSELTDEQLLQEAKKVKSTAIIDAVLIGFLIGVVFCSVIFKSFSFLMLLPVYLAYKLINKPKYKKGELEAILRERNLK